MTIIFFGSDEFAAAHLEKLSSARHKILAVVTQPDKARGRHLKISELPVKEVALRYGYPVLQPGKITDKEFSVQLKDFAADIFVVIAYGKILPVDVLSVPRKFCINVHASLLPKYRGASPIHWAVINGDETTGVTIIKMNSQLDAGEIICQDEVPITAEDTTVTLKRKLTETGRQLLIKTLAAIEAGTFSCRAQEESSATYVAKLTKELGLIDWAKPAAETHNLVRGLQPWPGAYTFCQQKVLKILETNVAESQAPAASPGQVVKIGKEGFDVVTGRGILRVCTVHPESAKPMSAHSFILGQRINVGFRFG